MTESRGAIEAHLKRVWRYYDRTESRIGYDRLMGGSKHFGWYDEGESGWRFGPALAHMEDQIADRLDLAANSLVLDAGSGMGEVARAFASRHGLIVEGIDILDFNIEEALLRSAKKGLQARTRFNWGDYHSIAFADQTFDGVYTVETLVHAADSRQVLREFFRVLKPGGHIVLAEYSRAPDSELSDQALSTLQAVCEIAAMPTWLELVDGELENRLRDAGFEKVISEDVTEKILPMLRIFSLLGRLPYWVGRRISKPEKTINAMSGVEMYRHQEAWSYKLYTARKPA
jgi:sterol 24-C-methyltransferase